jgi:hypothetical protein
MDMPVTPLQDRIGVSQIFTVDFFCPDPTWYDPTLNITTFDGTNITDWWLGLGTITAGEVEEYVQNPTQGQSVDNGVLIADNNDWTIYARTNISTMTPASIETMFNVRNTAGTRQWRANLSTSTNRFESTGTDGSSVNGVFSSGDQHYFFVNDGGIVSVYRSTTLVGTTTAISGIDGSNVSSVWRAASSTPGESWTPNIDNAAIYNIALSSAQRVALIASASSALSLSDTINNPGSYSALPIIIITGPATDAVLTNVRTGEILDFTGVTIAAGDTYTVDCRYGYKTVKDAAGTNKISDLTTTSDLATFHLEPGDNAFTLVGTGTDANTQVTVRFNPRHIGI